MVIVIHWVTRNYGSKRTDPEGEVCLRRHNSLAISESLIYLLPEAIRNAGRQGLVSLATPFNPRGKRVW